MTAVQRGPIPCFFTCLRIVLFLRPHSRGFRPWTPGGPHRLTPGLPRLPEVRPIGLPEVYPLATLVHGYDIPHTAHTTLQGRILPLPR